MKYQNINCYRKNEFSIIEINRPYANNKLSVNCMSEILEAFEHSEHDNNCKVVILTGKGEFFCGGGDLGDYYQQNSRDILYFGNLLVKLHQKIAKFPKLVTAAVNGDVCGGGLSLLECCDLAVSVRTSSFSIPEINNELAPMISLMGIRNHFSRKQCMEMIAFGKELDAGTALSYGLINHITEREDVIDVAMEYVRKFLGKNEFAFSICKQYYNNTQGLSYDQQYEAGKYHLVTMLKSF
ncbi:hypothetical protein Ana3638_10150 [Anaerocolumna sedimenticola]|uniref:Enoyl-CoA hydratase n=1 Tax=Anaerocolumna sedimenticola TaxID=2696063 RepID=A0A6P1TN29_9FIRM|nr:enoyl-CoA hydratase/isomerase family protein [Anaerocolumna sedimenticola]QHQ61085.1 hypothetical protein Ana3638_10150 [Anaerocolumna sedimenticola]